MKKCFSLLAALTLSLHAQDKITVQVRVNCDDQELSNSIVSYVSRELRGLHDVELNPFSASHQLSIIADSRTNDFNHRPLFILSASALAPADLSYISLLYTNVPPQTLPTNAYWLDDHILYSGSDLRELCDSLVAAYDTRVLEHARRETQSINRFAQDFLKNHPNFQIPVPQAVASAKINTNTP